MHSNNLLQKRPPNIVQLTAIARRAGNDARDGKDCIKCNHQRAISLLLSFSFPRPNLLTLIGCPGFYAICGKIMFFDKRSERKSLTCAFIFFLRTKRMRRSASNPIFTEDQVHLLPGYPKQVSQIPLVAVIAFYLQSPLGSSIAVVTKDVVVEIVRSSMADISSAINANISNVRQLFADTTTAPSTATTIASSASSSLPTAQDMKEENSKTMMYIIVAVASVVVFVIIVALFVLCFCKGKER